MCVQGELCSSVSLLSIRGEGESLGLCRDPLRLSALWERGDKARRLVQPQKMQRGSRIGAVESEELAGDVVSSLSPPAEREPVQLSACAGADAALS